MHGYFKKFKLLLMVRSAVHKSMHACIQTPVADSNFLHIFQYMLTYESFTSNQVHNIVLSVSMNHVPIFSKGLIFFIFFFFRCVIKILCISKFLRLVNICFHAKKKKKKRKKREEKQNKTKQNKTKTEQLL